jgi:hypothetical protein
MASRRLHLIRWSIDATVQAVLKLCNSVPKSAEPTQELLSRPVSLMALPSFESKPLLPVLSQQLRGGRGSSGVLRASARLSAAQSEVRQWLASGLQIWRREATLTSVTDSARDSAVASHGRCAIESAVTC